MSASLTQNKNATPTHAHTFDREEAITYLDLIFGQKPAGFFALAFKVLEPSIAPRADREFNDYITIPHKEDGVVIDHFGWAERKFAPHEREEMFREIESRMAADLTKVMISLATYTKPTKRYLDNIKQIRVVHIDFDAPDGKPMDPQLYKLLMKARPVITASGSPNRFHGYIGVRNLTLDDHYTLEWAIRDKFNGDNKIAANDLLTLPGTYNIKDPDDPQPVRLLTGDRRLRMWSCIEEVAELLDLDLSSVPPRTAEVGVGTDESLDSLDVPVMRRLKRMAQQGRSGHSEANFGIVKDCKELGLTPGQTYTFITTMMGSAEYKEKGDDWLIGDIARIWDKPGKKDMKKATQSPKASGGSSAVTVNKDDLTIDEASEDDDNFEIEIAWASTIEPERQKWVWHNRIPQGALTLLGGREGCGKSQVTINLASQMTHGTLLGEYENQLKRVLFVTTEDAEKTVIIPRLMAANADLAKVGFVRVKKLGEAEPLDLTKHRAVIRRTVQQLDVGMIVLDPVISFLGDSVDVDRGPELRRVLEPINHLAEELGCALVGIVHFNKRDSNDVGKLISGSGVWSQVARSTIAMVADPDAEDHFILSNGKNTNAPKSWPSLSGKIEGKDVNVRDGVTRTSYVKWLGDSDRSVEEVMNPDRKSISNKEIDTWLKDLLTSKGSMLQADVLAAGKPHGYYRQKLSDSLTRIGGRHKKDGFGGKMYWSIPKHENLEQLEEPPHDPDLLFAITEELSIHAPKWLKMEDLIDDVGHAGKAVRAAIKYLAEEGFVNRTKVGNGWQYSYNKPYLLIQL